jgi:cyclase
VPFSKDGATVVAHENVKKRLTAGTMMAVPEVKYTPAPPDALPAKTYSDGMMLTVAGRSAQLKHPANAHTDGDTYVYFADANVLATGDTVAMNRYPNIDFANDGSLKGMIAASDAYLALANSDTKIVPGHGPLANKAQLAEYRAMLAAVHARMAKLIKDGKSEAEIYAAKPFVDFDAKFKATERMSMNWMREVYASVKSE